MKTYTRNEVMQQLGITSKTDFYHLRRTHPTTFVAVEKNTGRPNPTLYDKTALDKFIEWRKTYKNEASHE
jgi:hypothetical protein